MGVGKTVQAIALASCYQEVRGWGGLRLLGLGACCWGWGCYC
jgi:hypothetical protein